MHFRPAIQSYLKCKVCSNVKHFLNNYTFDSDESNITKNKLEKKSFKHFQVRVIVNFFTEKVKKTYGMTMSGIYINLTVRNSFGFKKGHSTEMCIYVLKVQFQTAVLINDLIYFIIYLQQQTDLSSMMMTMGTKTVHHLVPQ